jgi:hypothetical protein
LPSWLKSGREDHVQLVHQLIRCDRLQFVHQFVREIVITLSMEPEAEPVQLTKTQRRNRRARRAAAPAASAAASAAPEPEEEHPPCANPRGCPRCIVRTVRASGSRRLEVDGMPHEVALQVVGALADETGMDWSLRYVGEDYETCCFQCLQ